MKESFLRKGFASTERLIGLDEVEELQGIYNELLRDKKRTAHLRSDLAGGATNGNEVEKITQIMRPSMIVPNLKEHAVYAIARTYAQELLGEDMELDFDMLINKAPYTNMETPWHQDAAYWIRLPDKRSVSIWIALDEVYEENGCMWFIPKTKGANIEPHQALPNGGALFCKVTDLQQAECIPLSPGGCTFHDGFTLHFSKGNSTESQRRALILNFRPKTMIALEREQGVDHTGARKVRQR